MDKPYVPEKWKNLRLEFDDNIDDDIDDDNDCMIYKPRIIRTESILKNKKDVFKEKHKKYDDDCYDPKLNFKCVIL